MSCFVCDVSAIVRAWGRVEIVLSLSEFPVHGKVRFPLCAVKFPSLGTEGKHLRGVVRALCRVPEHVGRSEESLPGCKEVRASPPEFIYQNYPKIHVVQPPRSCSQPDFAKSRDFW